MSIGPALVLAMVAALINFAQPASAFAQLPPPPAGGPPPGGPPPGGPPPSGAPPGGPPGGGVPYARAPGGGVPHAGPRGVDRLPGRLGAGNVSGGMQGVSGGARFRGQSNYYSSRSYGAGSYSGSDYGRRGGYRYYGAAAAGAAVGYAYGRSYGDETYTYGDSSCYRTVRYRTHSGWRRKVIDVCE
jgi:hypothetical protein